MKTDEAERRSRQDPDDHDSARFALAQRMRLGFDPLENVRPTRTAWQRWTRGVLVRHKTTGIEASSCSERSQMANRRKAMVALRAKMAFAQRPSLLSVGLVRDWSRVYKSQGAGMSHTGRPL